MTVAAVTLAATGVGATTLTSESITRMAVRREMGLVHLLPFGITVFPFQNLWTTNYWTYPAVAGCLPSRTAPQPRHTSRRLSVACHHFTSLRAATRACSEVRRVSDDLFHLVAHAGVHVGRVRQPAGGAFSPV
ncbi:MAG: hypothetical protein HYY01_15295 [Chloroflexi bacterium]|nr:hypothetical protein [Chloroflexota bacterium]